MKQLASIHAASPMPSSQILLLKRRITSSSCDNVFDNNQRLASPSREVVKNWNGYEGLWRIAVTQSLCKYTSSLGFCACKISLLANRFAKCFLDLDVVLLDPCFEPCPSPAYSSFDASLYSWLLSSCSGIWTSVLTIDPSSHPAITLTIPLY